MGPNPWGVSGATSWSEPDSLGVGGTERQRPLTAFPLVRGRLHSWWRVKDSNLGSFRDGFTVRSHWPLGQPARHAAVPWLGGGSKDNGTPGASVKRVASGAT